MDSGRRMGSGTHGQGLVRAWPAGPGRGARRSRGGGLFCSQEGLRLPPMGFAQWWSGAVGCCGLGAKSEGRNLC